MRDARSESGDLNAVFPTGGGALGELIRDYNWAATGLGPISAWPQSLKTTTNLLLLSPVPIVLLWGEDGVMIYNDAYSVFAGGRHPKLLGSKVREGWAEIADFNDTVMKVGLSGRTLAYKDQELTLVRRGRPEPVWMNLDYSPVLDESGRPAGVIAIVVETTERVLADRRLRESEERFRAHTLSEEALRQTQRMEAVGQLTGGLAHDFNNILAGISGSLELIQMKLGQGRIGDIDRYVGLALGATRRAASLTHRLLAFSRRQTLDPKPTNINRLVAGMEELIRRSVGPEIAFKTDAADGLWNTLVDAGQLENALLNLCLNARDAMPDGGRLTIETANHTLEGKAARERDLPPGPYVSLCVRDTGAGMPPDVVARAFDPFFTTKPIGQGTGLGLSMVYGFARQSGGLARIETEHGEGSAVCIYLPRHLAEVEEDVSGAAEASRVYAGHTILVVDDEPLVRLFVTEVLGDLGYATLEAEDASVGLDILRSNARIDLLISDVGLPNGMNGRQLADAARELRPGLKVLFITGYAENALLSEGHLGSGMQAMTKPFTMEELAVRLRDIFGEG